ncbi:MAG TPA: hypothetical protein VLH08_06025 [Acidobacteriota bacterium]|nr:hypothetical protein [Acidobacteriota bacterium]
MFRRWFFAGLLFCFPLTGNAWTSKTYQLIVVKSTQLMPTSFKNIMMKHQEEILAACLRPDDLPESEHTYNIATHSGYLKDQLLNLSAKVPKDIYNHVPFTKVAEDFGRMSHYIADLNNPLILSDQDSRETQYRSDFAIYLEKNIELFPWIFDGHEPELLKESSAENYLQKIAMNAVERYGLIGDSYFPNGTLVSSDTFDPRSLPFGIASLSYSRSISHTVQFWFYTWKKARGDTTWTPFFSKGKTKKKEKK